MLKHITFYGLLILAFFQTEIIAQNPTDCIDAVVICGNSSVNLDVSGIGTQELNGSNTCSSQENNSIWLKVTLITSGTLGFTLTPNSSSIGEDYDFFVFGPNVSCSNIGLAIRCSTTNPQAAFQGNNLTGMNSSSTDTAEGPGGNGDSFVKWLDVQAGETYFIVIDRPIGNSPFNLQWTGTATFADPPTDQSSNSSNPINLISCDVTLPFDDAFTVFNLEDNTGIIQGTQTDIAITYHETESDAILGINSLTSPYSNISNPQIIYSRIENTVTNCFEISSFSLGVNLGPDYFNPTIYEVCDNAVDGNGNNGRVIFDFQPLSSILLDGQDPTNININYYTSENDAIAENSPLPNSYYNSTPFNEEIFVRIEDNFNPDCTTIIPLNLIVNENPEAFNHTILQCDEDGIVDGISLFNLNQANSILTGGIANRSTKFYTDNARTIETDGASFANTFNPQTIYVTVFNDDTGCKSNSELTLEVSLTDSNNSMLSVCDDDGLEDGFYEFNLNNADNDIINGLPTGLNISYFETYDDALLEVNSLSINYTNTIAFNQTIFARVENANNCYGISEIELTVNELPNIDIEELELYCLNTFPNTITLNAGLLNDSPNNYTYNWSSGENTYEIEINDLATYNVTVTNINGCFKERIILVEPSNIATIQSIEVIDASQNNTITVFTTGEGIYEFSLLDENNTIYLPYQESNSFQNIAPGLYTVIVRDTKNNCGTVQENISVIGFPKFFTPNNDGINDTWQVYGISSVFQSDSKILIFNRFGKLLKEINPLDEGWDGFFNGEKLPTDDYWFSVTLQDGRIFKNHFTLKY